MVASCRRRPAAHAFGSETRPDARRTEAAAASIDDMGSTAASDGVRVG